MRLRIHRVYIVGFDGFFISPFTALLSFSRRTLFLLYDKMAGSRVIVILSSQKCCYATLHYTVQDPFLVVPGYNRTTR